jgi:hypothetical protein
MPKYMTMMWRLLRAHIGRLAPYGYKLYINRDYFVTRCMGFFKVLGMSKDCKKPPNG